MQSVKKRPLRLTLILLYIAVILVPGIVLGGLALRALDREEAYVEKTLANSLLTEVAYTADTVRVELTGARVALRDALTAPVSGAWYSTAPLKKASSPLVDTIFVLSAKKEILWPNEAAVLSEDEKRFLYWNAPLMTDRVKVPVVKNIVLEYQDEIINPAAPDTALGWTETEATGGANKDDSATARENQANAQAQDGMLRDERREAAGERDAGAPRGLTAVPDELARNDKKNTADKAESRTRQSSGDADPERSPAPSKTSLEKEKEKRAAINIFEQNKPIQEKIYRQAEEEGKEVLTRTTTVKKGQAEASLHNERSQFILSPGTFSDVIAGADEGFLPRFLGDEFSLLYWKKNNDGGVIGCVVNLDALRERILKSLPAETSPARVLVVLDERGQPLHTPAGLAVDWRAPFVAREIHEALPRWEVAAYLADPSYIATKAEATTSVLWVLTFFLLVAIAGGGIIVIKMLLSELALAQKKTNLVTNVSHELKTPLTSIRLFAEMLMADVPPSGVKRREYCGLLLSETERLSRLINNVLDFSRMSQGKKQYDKKPLDLAALCREVANRERIRLAQAGLSLAFRSNTRKVPFSGCRESLTRVLINLVSNAEKYASGGKRIDIVLENRPEAIVLSVMDRGPGIPAWAAKKIFKEFFRVDDSLTAKTSGSGLGLTICRMIVTGHGGEIAFEPRPGGGSIFRIVFRKE